MKVKILENEGTKTLEKLINDSIAKGWKIKGGIIKASCGYAILMYKK